MDESESAVEVITVGIVDDDPFVCAALGDLLGQDLEIAQTAGLTESTVKAHMSAIMARLEVSSRVKAVVRAYQLGLARP